MHGKDDFVVIKPKREAIVEIKAKRPSENVGLTITPNGFSIGDTSYSWYDIEQFGVVRKYTSAIHPVPERQFFGIIGRLQLTEICSIKSQGSCQVLRMAWMLVIMRLSQKSLRDCLMIGGIETQD